MNSDRLELLERELKEFGLLDKSREIFEELGARGAISYIKSSYHHLSKVFHPDMNPSKADAAHKMQMRLNTLSQLIDNISEDELLQVIKSGIKAKSKGKTRILVVEDEFGLQETLRDVFLMEGYDVRIAVDGVNGLQAFREFTPDLIFTDVVMPNMDGIELVRKVREIDPKVKVIFSSGFFGIERVKRELNAEILRYRYQHISKPFKISEMLTMVESYLHGDTHVDIIV
jgi:two-component system response regulator (stage 0 sporulation protein F)